MSGYRRSLFTSQHTCDVTHRRGSTAQTMCPVHGDFSSASAVVAPPGLRSGALGAAAGESSVPGYKTSTWKVNEGRWEDEDGNPHRIDGPYKCEQATTAWNKDAIRFSWAVNGRETTMEEVFGRYAAVMCGSLYPSTTDGLRDSLGREEGTPAGAL